VKALWSSTPSRGTGAAPSRLLNSPYGYGSLMIALVLSLAMGAVGAQSTPSLLFDHGSFCLQMQDTAGQDEVRAGAVIDRWTKHGGIAVDCEHRAIDFRSLLSRPVTKSWLKIEQRHWEDDICSDPAVAEAIRSGWKLTASIVVNGDVIAVFEAKCNAHQ
jgi:hypothetical protein